MQLDHLPHEVIGTITTKLASGTSVTGVCNEKDIYRISKTIYSLEQVNKYFYALLSRGLTSNIFINDLGKRFKCPEIIVAAFLNTSGSLDYLRRYFHPKSESKACNKSVIMSIKDLPAQCMDIIKRLKEQPLLQNGNNHMRVGESRELLLPFAHDCHIVKYLFDRVNEYLPDNQKIYLRVYEFDKTYKLVERVIEENAISQLCLDTYKNIVQMICKAIVIGWEKSKLKDHEDIMYKRSEKEYDLLVKKVCFPQESAFLNLCAQAFHLDMHACGDWERDKKDNASYVWVKKDSKKQLCDALSGW